METETILITVRTYPAPSSAHVELVCTGGITQSGEWRRLFPIPLRYLEEEKQFNTYDVIKLGVDLSSDTRLESRRPNLLSLKRLDRLDSWSARQQWVGPTIIDSMRAMLDAQRTLAPVAVQEILSLDAEDDDPEWTPAQLEKLRQERLFENNKPLEKIPYKFIFRWRDGEGQEHRSRCISWEMCQTWRNWRKNYDDPIKMLKDKFLNEVCGPDRYIAFYMGNYRVHPQHYAVTGIYHPPKSEIQNAYLW